MLVIRTCFWIDWRPIPSRGCYVTRSLYINESANWPESTLTLHHCKKIYYHCIIQTQPFPLPNLPSPSYNHLVRLDCIKSEMLPLQCHVQDGQGIVRACELMSDIQWILTQRRKQLYISSICSRTRSTARKEEINKTKTVQLRVNSGHCLRH